MNAHAKRVIARRPRTAYEDEVVREIAANRKQQNSIAINPEAEHKRPRVIAIDRGMSHEKKKANALELIRRRLKAPQRASLKAIRRLVKLMEDEDIGEGVRCNAARSILETHFRNCEFTDIEESITELRRVVNDLPATKKGLRVV